MDDAGKCHFCNCSLILVTTVECNAQLCRGQYILEDAKVPPQLRVIYVKIVIRRISLCDTIRSVFNIFMKMDGNSDTSKYNELQTSFNGITASFIYTITITNKAFA